MNHRNLTMTMTKCTTTISISWVLYKTTKTTTKETTHTRETKETKKQSIYRTEIRTTQTGYPSKKGPKNRNPSRLILMQLNL